MTGNLVIDILIIVLSSIAVLVLVFFILGKFFEPVRKMNNSITGFGKNLRHKREQKRILAEQERREEIERLEEKQQVNKAFISAVKNGLNDLHKAYKELENEENKVSAMYDDIKDKIMEIDILNEKPSKFILKLMNEAKIKKMTMLCDKQKKSLKKAEETYEIKREEMKGLISVFSDSFNDN